MAFFGILILDIVLMILMGMAAAGVVALAFCLVLSLRYIGRKMGNKPVKKRGLAAAVGCGIAGILLLVLPVTLMILIWPDEKVTVRTNQGQTSISELTAENFSWALHSDDAEKVAEMLEKNPELLDYTMDSMTPLGAAIDSGSIEVARFLLEYGVDVNKADCISFDTSMTLACRKLKFQDRQFNFEILNLLLDHGATMNDKINGTTPVQYLISYILEDLNVTLEEREVLERFLEAGAYLTIQDMSGDDAMVYFEEAVEEKTLTKLQQARIDELRELLQDYYERQGVSADIQTAGDVLSYQELANILAEFEIAEVSPAQIDEMEQQWAELPEEARESLNKMSLLLTAAGAGTWDFEKGTWTPSSEKVYSFDMEAFDVENMYAVLFEGLESISRNYLHFSDVVQEDGTSYYDRKVSFKINDAAYEFCPEFGGDWYDVSVLDLLNEILAQKESGMQFYFMTDGYQQVIVFFCDDQWAQTFSQRTGCALTNSAK